MGCSGNCKDCGQTAQHGYKVENLHDDCRVPSSAERRGGSGRGFYRLLLYHLSKKEKRIAFTQVSQCRHISVPLYLCAYTRGSSKFLHPGHSAELIHETTMMPSLMKRFFQIYFECIWNKETIFNIFIEKPRILFVFNRPEYEFNTINSHRL